MWLRNASLTEYVPASAQSANSFYICSGSLDWILAVSPVISKPINYFCQRVFLERLNSAGATLLRRTFYNAESSGRGYVLEGRRCRCRTSKTIIAAFDMNTISHFKRFRSYRNWQYVGYLLVVTLTCTKRSACILPELRKNVSSGTGGITGLK